MELRHHLKAFPFIAITRGITPDEAAPCGAVLSAAGFRIIETPLNSPDPLTSIGRMAKDFGHSILIGAGTVTEVDQVQQVKEAGGKVIVSPHCNPDIIQATKKAGLISIPGVATPTEAITALQSGADALKLFPAEIIPPAAVKAMRAILPEKTLLLPVGGIDSTNWTPYMQAGASGFGLGSSLYKKGLSATELKENSRKFADSWQDYHSQPAGGN